MASLMTLGLAALVLDTDVVLVSDPFQHLTGDADLEASRAAGGGGALTGVEGTACSRSILGWRPLQVASSMVFQAFSSFGRSSVIT